MTEPQAIAVSLRRREVVLDDGQVLRIIDMVDAFGDVTDVEDEASIAVCEIVGLGYMAVRLDCFEPPVLH
jgi:hypothetical protein